MSAARQLRHPFFRTPCKVTIDGQLYKVQKKLDNGSFGQVYVAHQLNQEDQLIAIKVMSHERIQMTKQSKRIQQEINLHSQINTKNVDWFYQNQPGIVRLYAYDHDVKIKKKLYKCMVMEYCEGSHLNHYLRHHPSDCLEEIEAFYFFQQIMRSLQCLHRQYIIHRDIKPQNLLLSHCEHSLPVLKLCDFGLAKRLPHSTSTTHSMCGTPNYVAPEIVNAEGHSYGADIWSAGIVLYIMLVKHHQPPFETGNIQLTMAKVRDNEVIIPKYLSAECQSFLSQLLIKNKSRRITAQQLKQETWYRENKKKLNDLLQRGLKPINTLHLRNYSKCFQNMGCIYEIENQTAQLSWGGREHDDYTMSVDQKGVIRVSYGGIANMKYTIHTLPVGFHDKYTQLCEFVEIQSENTPLITISIVNDGMHCEDGFNKTHYATLVHAQIVDYNRTINDKAKLFIQYTKDTDEYIGIYNDCETNTETRFNVLESKKYEKDIVLFQKLKQKLFGELTQQYINLKSNALKFPILLQYIEGNEYGLNTVEKPFRMSIC